MGYASFIGRMLFTIQHISKDERFSTLNLKVEKDDDFDNEFEEKLNQKLNSRFPQDKKEKKIPSQTPVFLNGLNKWQVVNRALFAGVFVAGIGTGGPKYFFNIT